MIEFIVVLLMGFADLYRGAQAGLPRLIEKFLLASLALIALVGLASFESMMSDWRFALAYLLLFSAACSVSWGAVIGGSLNRTPDDVFQAHIDAKNDKGDWYLVGPFRKSAIRGLFARSVVWGVLASVPFFVFGYSKEGLVMLITYSISMPAAIYFLRLVEGSAFDKAIGRMCLKLVKKDRAWARHEVYRGWIAGLILLAGALM